MIELRQHIITLLLKHNCVIVPNLGGFVAQDCSANFIAEENLFAPPYRSVAFNPLLQMNDGLLAQSYMRSRGATYSEALQIIDNTVHLLKSKMMQQGGVELAGIGKLSGTPEGEIDFEPAQGGIVAPRLCGLDSFALSSDMINIKREKTRNKVHTAYYTLKVRKTTFHRAVAAVAIVVFGLFWSPSLHRTSLPTTEQAQMFGTVTNVVGTSVTEEKETQQSIESSIAPKVSSKNTREKKEHQSELTRKSVSLEQSQQHHKKSVSTFEKSTPSYSIVVASQVTKIGAMGLIEKLEKKGIDSLRIYTKNNVNRVVLGCFATHEEAQQRLRKLRDADEVFRDAWILTTTL